MKKNVHLLLLGIVWLLIVTGCRKNEAYDQMLNPSIIQQITKYLAVEEVSLMQNKKKKLDPAFKEIDLSSVKQMALLGEGDYAVNVSTSTASMNKKAIFRVWKDTIRSAGIITVRSLHGEPVDNEMFFDIAFFHKKPFSATITFNVYAGHLPEEFTINNGEIAGNRRPVSKPHSSSNTRPNNAALSSPFEDRSSISQDPISFCANQVDWYLNTYNENGELVSSEYVYTTCEDNFGGGGSSTGNEGSGGNHSKMCGGENDYNWTTIGNAYYAQFSFVGFNLVSGNGDLLFLNYGYPCIQFAKANVGNKAQASQIWNEAWNSAVDAVLQQLDSNGPMGEFYLKQTITNTIREFLKSYPGSSLNPTGCTDNIQRSNPKWCL